MEVTEQIMRFKEFLEAYYLAELLENIRLGKKYLLISFSNLLKHDPEIAELILEDPEETIRSFEICIENFDAQSNLKNFRIRLSNLSKNQNISIKDIRSNHIGKLFSIEGIVRQKSDVRPQVTVAKFECPSCGNVMSVIQVDTAFKEPFKCGCGRKGKFRLLDKELVDAQRLVLEENTEDLEGGEQPKRMSVYLRSDLVSPFSEKKTNPGSKIRVIGQIKEVPVILRTGGKSTTFDLMIDANNVEGMEESYGEVIITPDEEKEIIELSQDKNLMLKLIRSVAPSIYGHEKVKEALLLQMMSGVRKKRDDGMLIRGDIHILLIGDPGSGKSQLLKRISVVAPKSRFVSGKGASGVGLTASVVRDEFLKGWSLEAGALVLANHGFCMIDELDKMDKEDRAAMHEALEQQSVSIAKANIQATLRSETTVLAAANPKFGRFDPYGTISEQIDLPPTLINRFDLIFPIKDMPNPEHDEKIAKFILTMHQDVKMENPDISTKLLKKYISYARQKIKPELTDGAIEEIKEYYVKMRGSGSSEGGVKSIPISARQLEALVRLSEAAAKVRLSSKVIRKDAKRAIDLVHYCLMQVGMDQETGKFDIDRISTGITASQRSKISQIREIINELEEKLGKTIPIEDVIKLASERGIDEHEVEETIEKLKRSGDLYEPRHGLISRI